MKEFDACIEGKTVEKMVWGIPYNSVAIHFTDGTYVAFRGTFEQYEDTPDIDYCQPEPVSGESVCLEIETEEERSAAEEAENKRIQQDQRDRERQLYESLKAKYEEPSDATP